MNNRTRLLFLKKVIIAHLKLVHDEYILKRKQSRKTLLLLQSCVGIEEAAAYFWRTRKNFVFVFLLIQEWKDVEQIKTQEQTRVS